MADLGKAYVQIVPSAQGISGSITQALGGEVDSAGKNGGTSLGKKIGGFAMKAFAAMEVGKFIKDTIQAGADFEQLKGGIEKIFDEANQSQIFEDANKAYKELNLSANDYLSTITNVGAAFASSMGDQKGYDVARAGMLAVSDYATGTGKNVDLLNEKFQMISRSTSSYQSIADQFAGLLPQTSKDFLAQAQAAGFLSDGYKSLTEVPVAEYQQALVQMMQKGTAEMGLAGNTAAETSKTISGSLAGMQSAFSNFMTQLVAGEDIEGATQDLMNSAITFAENLVPALLTILEQIPTVLKTFAESVVENLKNGESREQMIQGAVDFICAMIEGIVQATPAILEAIVLLVVAIIETIIQYQLTMLSHIVNFITGTLLPAIAERWEAIKAAVVEKVTAMVEAVKQWFINLKDAIVAKVLEIWTGITERFTAIKTAVTERVQATVQGVSDKFENMKNSIKSKCTEIVSGVRERFQAAKDAISEKLEAARDKVKSIIDKIKGFFKFKISWPHIPVPHFSISPSGWKIGDLLKGSIPKLSVSWHAEGAIFKKPTILHGLGDAGEEAALPLDPFWSKMDAWGNSILDGMAVIASGMERDGDITVETYLYPNGPKMDEYTYKSYNRGKARLGNGTI